MNFAFLTSSLEPGQDGVGDYTRALGRALSMAGHRCLLISLNDVAVEKEAPSPREKVIRLAGKDPWSIRTEQVYAALREFQPDWVSLQFVCYGFHSKGLVFGLAAALAPLFALGRGHVMLHELWIGESLGYSLKDRVVGFFQKRGILRLLRVLRPAVIHTSNPVYVEILRRNSVSARELPLPGNIPVGEPEPAWLEATFRKNDAAMLNAGDRQNCWVVGVFGTIHPQWDVGTWLNQLCDVARERRKRLLLVHLGHTPQAGAAIWKNLATEYAARCQFLSLGRQPVARVSTVMQNLDFGIATSPWALIGKSGSVAALLDHGIPVIVPRDDWRLRHGITPEPTAHPLLFRPADFLAAMHSRGIKRRAPQPSASKVAEQMFRDLAASV